MATEKVMITVDWSGAESSDDAAGFLEAAAVREMRMGKGYNDTEIQEVQRDPTLKESCRTMAIRLHNRETSRKRAVIRGKAGTPERIVETVGIAYTRPVSRGMFNREIDGLKE